MTFEVSTLQYVELSNYKSESFLQVKYLSDFLSILEKKRPETVYKCRNELGTSDFIFRSRGVTYAYNTLGYKTIADLLKGNLLGFEGCNKKFDSYRITIGERKTLEEGDVYYKAMKLGYENLEEFEVAASKGFGNVEYEKYRAALSIGFKDYDDYSSAKEMHLDNDASLYFEAKEMRIREWKEFEVYSRLKRIKVQQQFDTFDKAQTYEILEREDFGSGSLEQILKILQTEKPRADSVTPKWYAQSINDDSRRMEEFLSKDASIAKLGSYNSRKKVFVKYPEMGLPPVEKSSFVEMEYRKKDERDKPNSISLNWQLRD